MKPIRIQRKRTKGWKMPENTVSVCWPAQPGILDDNIPNERILGITAGFVWGTKADKTVVYIDLGISKGMEWGIRNAESIDRAIEYRRLEKWQ